ncbi:MAG: hypothetical protein HOV68_01325 [Streptomycetaceae bacterium]|nr:hypothetical protein [Streptomycetaceae bacterium]
MKSATRRVLTVGAITALTAGIGVLGAGSANAATTNSVGAICGSGYQWVDTYAVSYTSASGSRIQLGQAILAYNPSNGYNCAYTFKQNIATQNNFYGYPTWTGIKLLSEGSTWTTDYGNYSYYAGPVYRYGKDRAVKLVADVGLYKNESWAHLATGWVHGG